MWRIGGSVYIQDRLIVDRDIVSSDVAQQFYSLVGKRATHSDDGTPLSEWQVPFADVLAFLVNE